MHPAGVPTRSEKADGYEIRVSGQEVWTDTGLELRRGDRILLTASGTVEFQLGQIVGPNGSDSAGIEAPPFSALPLSDAPRGALIARIGPAGTAVPILVGEKKEVDASSSGGLYLGINEYQPAEASGSFTVHVNIQRREASAASLPDAAAASLISPQVLADVPRRASDSHGQPKDLVNLLIIGSEQDVKLTFQAAGWEIVSRTDASAAMSRSALQGLSEAAYVARPLSDLYLFGRPQDFGFTDAELVTVVQARHYLRIWRNPIDVNGQALWVGAAAHDIGPWWNSRTGEVSYKIDPNVDRERDFVRDTLNETGLVEHFGYVKAFASSQRARMQAGSSLETDRRVLVITLVALPQP